LPPSRRIRAAPTIGKAQLLLIVMGAAAIIAVGAAYMSQVVRTET